MNIVKSLLVRVTLLIATALSAACALGPVDVADRQFVPEARIFRPAIL